MKRCVAYREIWVLVLPCAVAVLASAQTFTTLVNFDGANGNQPTGALLQGTDGNLYGTTTMGGIYGYGTVFNVSLSGTLSSLHSFSNNDGGGQTPYAGLVQATNGYYYGTTYQGGYPYNSGSIFSMVASGAMAQLDQFSGVDGAYPRAGLMQGMDGYLYGTTEMGGTGSGTIFKIGPGGSLTILYNFSGTDGGWPEAALVQAADGSLYGTTNTGGANWYGTIFKLTAGGTLTTLHSFNGTDGANPWSGLVQAQNGLFYGTANNIFSMTPAGAFNVLSSAGAVAGLIQGTDGNLYGTTFSDGGYGTVFKMTPSGTLTTLYTFSGTDGANPDAALLQETDGNLYGTTKYGGTTGNGTVFRFSAGLRPFIKSLPTTGKVATAVKILGTNLSNVTSVSFNGTPAAFTLVSPSLITTTVPAGATTGKLKIVSNGVTLVSNLPFRVR